MHITLTNFKTNYFNFPKAEIYAAHYYDGSLALIIVNPDNGDEDRLTTNVECVTPGCVVVANYSQNEGLAQEMERHGLGTVEKEVPIGYGTGYRFRLSESFKEALSISN